MGILQGAGSMRSVTIGFVTCVLCAIALPASAADLPKQGYLKAPAYPAPAFNWSGFYLGGHVGAGWASAATNDILDFDLKPKGVVGGIQGGFNYQFSNRIVVGLEADVSFADMNAGRNVVHVFGPLVTTNRSAFPIDTFGTVRGRVGYAFDRLLPYATGGFAWANTRMDYRQPQTLFGTFFANLSDIHDTNIRTGWSVGGGFEYALTDHWSAKAEYLYLDFGRADYAGIFLPGFGGIPFSVNTKLTMQTARVGVNYRF